MAKKRMNKKTQQYIAQKRIQTLFQLAEKQAFSGNMHLADRYVFLARNISMKLVTPIPKRFKQQFCKYCYHYMFPDVSCRVRIHRGKIIKYCHNCHKISRIPLRNQKK